MWRSQILLLLRGLATCSISCSTAGRTMCGPGASLGPGGNSRQTTGSQSPRSTRARVNMANDASLAKEKEMQSVFKSFKPRLKAS